MTAVNTVTLELRYLLETINDMMRAGQRELAELAQEAASLPMGSDVDRYNSLRREYVSGQVVALARVSGTLEARIQIDEIWRNPFA